MLGGGFPGTKQTISAPVWLTHTLLVAIGKRRAPNGGKQSHDSGSYFQVLLPSEPCSEVQRSSPWKHIRVRGWTHPERLTFQPQLGSVLGKVLDVYIFSHIQSSLQHCEMNVIIPTLLISKLSLREVNSFSQGHTA